MSGNYRLLFDPKSLTVRVKVAIQNPPRRDDAWQRHSGHRRTKAAREIGLAWTALMATGSSPQSGFVDPRTKTASLKAVSVAGYEARAGG